MGEPADPIMSETTPTPNGHPEPHSSPDVAATRVAHSRSVFDYLSRLSIGQMTLALVLALFVWQWLDGQRQLNVMQQELAKRLTEMDGNNKANQVLTRQSQEALSELSNKVTALESANAEAQSERAALETLYQEMSSNRDETALAEVEQMLMIASQQLQLSANVKAALIAMQQADGRLQRMDRPALNTLRKAINADMDKLRTLPTVDTTGITLRLDSLILAAESIPLNHEVSPTAAQPATPAPAVAPANESSWQHLWREIWQEARNMVRIEDMRKREMPLLSPTESFFLRENLKLRLLSARLALLSRDETSFRNDLKAATDWVKRYFDANSTDGKQALTALHKLGTASIDIDLPDINGSIETVRAYRIAHEKAKK
jgi:uroporphyrin-3 C-methyltransferase